MVSTEQPVYTSLELNLPKPKRWIEAELAKPKPPTPSEWFATRFPEQAKLYGCPFLEMCGFNQEGQRYVNPVKINIDFFAAMLGGDIKLGHSIVYFEPEMQFYFKEPFSRIYMPTTSDKLQNQFRAWLIRCAQEASFGVDKLNLFDEFRSDKTSKAVVQRAKSVLAANHTFFSATSPHQRVKGPELHERLMRSLCENMLERSDGACLTVTETYGLFCRLAQQHGLATLKRSIFKESMRGLVKDVHGVSLRHDVPDTSNRHQQAWKGLKLTDA